MTGGIDTHRLNLVGKTSAEIVDALSDSVDRPFRARQVARWVNTRYAVSFDAMTDVSRDLRRRLGEDFAIQEPTVVETVASDDGTIKFLFGLGDGALVEGVAMQDGRKATLCVSSQTGCAIGCSFCVTGAVGAGRNLQPSEIVGHYRVMRRRLGGAVERINVVFMGMGEPLLNTASVGHSMAVLAETVSLKRITVSTAGVVPGIRWLATLDHRPKLAVSLNAPDQERRARLMPIARRYPLADLMAALREFPLERGRRITFEYVLISDFNEAPDDARRLADLISGLPCKVNLIPLNEDRERFPDLRRPSLERIDRFASALRDAAVTVTVRWSRGVDVAAACGQLRGGHDG